MEKIHFILFKAGCSASFLGRIHNIKRMTLVMSLGPLIPSSIKNNKNIEVVSFSKEAFIEHSEGLKNLISPAKSDTKFQLTFEKTPINKEILDAFLNLKEVDTKSLFLFIYTYCLGMNRGYYSDLWNHVVGGKTSILNFILNNINSSDTVSDYAEHFKISVRSLNHLFLEQFNVSAKQWIINRRVENGRKLLLTTNLKISEIAIDCGFSNHAHFSEVYKKKYGNSPSSARFQNLQLS